MSKQKRDFDKVAASWDQNPARIKLAEDVARAIAGQVRLTRDMDVLDFGCGTGLLTLQLQPKVRSIVGVDSSEGMLGVFQVKIAQAKLTNVEARRLDPDKGQVLSGRFDLVVSSMTLHHVPNVAPLLAQFRRVLKPTGCLCVADLDLDGGRFHEDRTGVFHPGFDRPALEEAFRDAGFDDVRSLTAAEVLKPAAGGETGRFTVFLIIGQQGEVASLSDAEECWTY